MIRFKQYIKENHVLELEKGLHKLNSHDYDTINDLMMKICKKHDITGQELHNDFKEKHGKVPDEWIKEELFDLIEDFVTELAEINNVDPEVIWEDFEEISDEELYETAAWQKKAGKNPEGGLNQKGVDSYRREHPGSKLKTAVTTKPSKLKPGSKAANRRKSFCARMSGMKKRLTSAKTARDPDSRINKSLRKWNC